MVAILCFNSLRYAQYLYKYTAVLNRNNIAYEVIFWQRENEELPTDFKFKCYQKRLDTFQPFYKKIFGFLGYVSYLKKQIKKGKYSHLIVLTSQTAVPLCFVLKKYKNKFIYDYRDITYENLGFYKKIVNKLISLSYFTAVSSLGFLKNFDKSDKVIVAHNSRDIKSEIVKKTKSDKIRVTFWGMVRQVEFNKKICDLFANDDRFVLAYHGGGFYKELEQHVKENNYNNITFTGEYNLDDIKQFCKDTDILLNLYDNDKRQQPAMTVKYYDSVRFAIPSVVNDNSYMAQKVKENNIGFVINPDDKNCLDKLYSEYNALDKKEFLLSVQKVLDKIKSDDEIFEKEVVKFCSK
ncbi:MAG: hypothetical protein UHN02_03525 [Acutalibacteraceae bacterium]|nr:hypothetical protein [Acutalibacteraceae bacterium]